MSGFPVEICIDQPEHAQLLQGTCCQRIEMCSNLNDDGLTPCPTAVEQVCEMGFDVVAMVRPRPGNFCYSNDELATMKRSIPDLLSAGASGIVLGLLDSSGRIPFADLQSLVADCDGLPVTFHRAFDHCSNRSEDLEVVIRSGCRRLLTSAGAETAWEGRQELSKLVQQAQGRLDVIAGGGVRPGHAARLIEASGVPWIHLSARRGSQSPDPDLLLELTSELASIDR